MKRPRQASRRLTVGGPQGVGLDLAEGDGMTSGGRRQQQVSGRHGQLILALACLAMVNATASAGGSESADYRESEEAFEIGVGEADAITLCDVLSVRDTLITTRVYDDGRKRQSREIWLTARVIRRLKAPIGLRVEGTIEALVWPTNRELWEIRQSASQQDRSVLFLKRHQKPVDSSPDPIASSVPWILMDLPLPVPGDFIAPPAARLQVLLTKVSAHVESQSLPQLARQADVVVVAMARDGEPCSWDGTKACVPLTVESTLYGHLDRDRVHVAVGGFGLPRTRAVYFLQRANDGTYAIVGKRGGVLTKGPADTRGDEAWLAGIKSGVLAARHDGKQVSQ